MVCILGSTVAWFTIIQHNTDLY